MKIDAVGVATNDMAKTVEFYTILGFDFSGIDINEGHVEPKIPAGSAKLMIDKAEIVREIIGEEPKPGNHSQVAIKYDSAEEIDQIVEKLKQAGFAIFKEPWDAFWGQRYAVLQDPGGYRVDLFADLS